MRVNRLDRAALTFITALVVVIVIIILRGDQVGVQIVRTSPEMGTTGVATRAQVSFSFSEPMPANALDGRIMISPALTGTVRWNGSTGYLVPQLPLQPDTVYSVTIKAGAHSERGRLMLRDIEWVFQTGHPRVVYLSPASETGNLYVREPNGNTPPIHITSEPYGVFDFAVSPDGRRIVYSATRDSNGVRDLWLINADGSGGERLIACDEQVCQTPSWSSDGTRIAFERRNLVQGALGKSPGPSRIWLYDFTSNSAAALLSDSQQLGNLPHWAPSGDKLSFYDPVASAVTVIDVTNGDRVQLPSVLGDPGTWSPNGTQLIYPELKAVDTGQFNQLLRADLVSNVITAVMPLSTSNDTSVVWSPLGSLIAFSRQRMLGSGSMLPFGPQVWVSTPEGRDARAITHDSPYSYGGLAWSPDGNWIVLVRNNLEQPNPQPEVWVVRSDGGQIARVAVDATIPAWLP